MTRKTPAADDAAAPSPAGLAPADHSCAGLSYEEARDQLIAIVARLEAGAATLEESMTLWERGEALAAHCQALLDGASQRIVAKAQGDGGDIADAGIVAIASNDEE